MSTFFQGICQIGVFMICAQTFVHFCPKGTYEKYLKMLVSIMVLIQIISPIGKLFSGKYPELENMQTGEWLESVLMKSMDELLVDEKDMAGENSGWIYEEASWSMEIEAESVKMDDYEKQTDIYIEPVTPICIGQ